MANPTTTAKNKIPGKPGAPKKEDTDVIHIRLPVKTIEELDKLAHENATNRNSMAQIAIAKLLKSGL